MVEPLVVVVNRHRQNLLGVVLTNHVVVENLADIHRGRHPVTGLDHGVLVLFTDDVHAEFDAFVTDEHSRPGNELPDLVLTLSAERAVQGVLRIAATGLIHCHYP